MFKRIIFLILFSFSSILLQFCCDPEPVPDQYYKVNGIKSSFQSDTARFLPNQFIPIKDSSELVAYNFLIQIDLQVERIVSIPKKNYSFGSAYACSQPDGRTIIENSANHLRITALEDYNDKIKKNDTIPLNQLKYSGNDYSAAYSIKTLFDDYYVKNLRIIPPPILNSYHRFKIEIFTENKNTFTSITPYVYLK